MQRFVKPFWHGQTGLHSYTANCHSNIGRKGGTPANDLASDRNPNSPEKGRQESIPV